MIVWGSALIGNVGMAYNLDSDTWRYISPTNAPSPRRGHGAVWTGRQMAIWGGSGASFDEYSSGTGALYDPVSDQWEIIPRSGDVPSGGDGTWAKYGERGVDLAWTGEHLIAIPVNTYSAARRSFVQPGGRYNPALRTWERIETTGVPNGRPYIAAWNGHHLFVAGSSGNDFAGIDYDFATKRWKEVVRERTGSFQGRIGTVAPELNELLIFGGEWVDGVDEYSGGPEGKRGFRLRLTFEADMGMDGNDW